MTEALPTPRREGYAESSKRIYEATPFVEWNNFALLFEWHQGEHISLIGPTGSGKTTLSGYLLENPPIGRFKPHSAHWYWKSFGQAKLEPDEAPRPYVVIFANKRRDEVAEGFISEGYTRLSKWEELTPCTHETPCHDGIRYPRRVLWPKAGKLGSNTSQREVFEHALNRIYAEEGWTVYVDDAIFVVDQEMLRLRPEYRDSLYRVRASGVTLLQGIQRPSGVPREMYSQVHHIFFWRTNDEADLDRIQGIGGLSGRQIRAIVINLELHEVLYVNTIKQQLVRTKTPA